MSDITLIPKYDKHGSETESFFRYVFGQVNSPVSGVIYIRRDTPIPDKLMLMFNKYSDKFDAKEQTTKIEKEIEEEYSDATGS